MWAGERASPVRGFLTPPPQWNSSKAVPYSPQRWAVSEKKKKKTMKKESQTPQAKDDSFHVIYKVPAGDSPYVKAKQVQLIEKDPSRAISLFWAAINSGDRVDSALKDMAVVMKQLNRSDEAVEAIKSFRHLCPLESQESLDNVLVELYKRSGRLEEQIDLLEYKLKCIDEGIAFGGRKTKVARSQGKKIQITIEQERSRLLGNLAWAYMQQNNYRTAEKLYRIALSLEPDKNKECNLAICWMHMNRVSEAKFLLEAIKTSSGDGPMDESYAKSFERACQALSDVESQSVVRPNQPQDDNCREQSSFSPNPTNETWKKHTSPCQEGCPGHVSGLLDSRRWGIAEEGTVVLNEQYSRNELGDDGSYGLGAGNPSLRSVLQSIPQKPSANECGRRLYSEEGRSVSSIGIKEGLANKNAYASPLSSRGTQKVPFTEPARGSLMLNGNKNQRRGSYGDAAFGGASRKLSFDQHLNIHQNGGAMAMQDSARPSVASIENAKVVQKCQRSSLSRINSNYIGDSWRDFAQVKDETIPEAVPSRAVVGDGKHTPPAEGFSDADLQMNNTQGSEAFIHGDRDRSPYNSVSSSEKASGYGSFTEARNAHTSPNIASHDEMIIKKSWADMAEEDEQEELLYGESTNHLESRWDCSAQEASFSLPRAGKCAPEGRANGEEFCKENLNHNIIHQTSPPASRTENVNLDESFKSLELKNLSARRSLPFDQQEKALSFDGYSYVLSNEGDTTSGSGSTKTNRRNRLQVFQDITLSESPRA